MRFLVLAFLLVKTAGAQPALRITFTPQSDTFAAATDGYRQLWAAEGERITRALERHAKLQFDTAAVTAIVYESVSFSGYRATPMKLRASYPPDTKKATLMHELGHRLESGLFHADEDDHRYLFLWLYEAWDAALALSPEQRLAPCENE